MKTMTVRLPEALVAELEAEARRKGVSKSDVIRERLAPKRRPLVPAAVLADLIGSVDGLPPDLSSRKKEHLRATGYGRKGSR